MSHYRFHKSDSISWMNNDMWTLPKQQLNHMYVGEKTDSQGGHFHEEQDEALRAAWENDRAQREDRDSGGQDDG